MTSTSNSTSPSLMSAEGFEEGFYRSEQHIAVYIVFIVGMCGIVANVWAIRIIWKSEALRNCFGRLLILHASANSLVLCCFAFWTVPVTLFDESLARSVLGFKIGQIMMGCYYATFYAQLAKAFNRLFAIANPVKYRIWFCDENSKFILFFVTIFGLLHGALYFLPGCNIYYDVNYLRWEYEETPCYDVMSTYIDLIVNCSIIGSTIFIDTCTLCLIIKRGLFSGKINKEVKFFIQAFTTSILYSAAVISDQTLFSLNGNKWYEFMTSTFAWEMCHTVDGILMVAFNFRKQGRSRVTSIALSQMELNTRSFVKIM